MTPTMLTHLSFPSYLVVQPWLSIPFVILQFVYQGNTPSLRFSTENSFHINVVVYHSLNTGDPDCRASGGAVG